MPLSSRACLLCPSLVVSLTAPRPGRVSFSQQTNVYNSATAEVVELWTQYLQNVRFNLSSESAHKAKEADQDGRSA